MRRLIVGLTGVLLAAAALSACVISGRSVRETHLEGPMEPNSSFIFGFLDMEDASAGMEWAYLKQMKPPVFDPDFKTRAREGVFYLENLPRGTFRLDGFGGNTWSPFKGGTLVARHSQDYILRMASPVTFEIKRPGVYFVGAYRFVHQPGKDGEDDTFNLQRIAQPPERDVLARIIDQAKGTPWERMLNDRLAKLK